MKALFGILMAALVLYTMYYDLHTGTLPQSPQASASTKQQETPHTPAVKVKVTPGATVMSIVEHENPKLSVSIHQVVEDFEKLNPGVRAHDITIGKVYSFPVYNHTH